VFNDFDTGDESTGFHLPSFPQFDIPPGLADRLFDPTTGLLAFDTDDILGPVPGERQDPAVLRGAEEPWPVVIDRGGVIRASSEGPVAASEIQAALRPLLS
jgi:hypothetical protein